MFTTWLNQVGGKLKRQLLVSASIFCWAIWLSRNDFIFDKSPINFFIQVLYRGGHTGFGFGYSWKVMIMIRRRSQRYDKSRRWWPCRYLPTMNGDGVIEFMLKISLFVIWSLHHLDCCGQLSNKQDVPSSGERWNCFFYYLKEI
jgi:hypothetical protein